VPPTPAAAPLPPRPLPYCLAQIPARISCRASSPPPKETRPNLPPLRRARPCPVKRSTFSNSLWSAPAPGSGRLAKSQSPTHCWPPYNGKAFEMLVNFLLEVPADTPPAVRPTLEALQKKVTRRRAFHGESALFPCNHFPRPRSRASAEDIANGFLLRPHLTHHVPDHWRVNSGGQRPTVAKPTRSTRRLTQPELAERLPGPDEVDIRWNFEKFRGLRPQKKTAASSPRFSAQRRPGPMDRGESAAGRGRPGPP